MSKAKIVQSSLCFSCSNSTVAETFSGRYLIKCEYFGRRIYDIIINCNSYRDKKTTNESELKEIAWVIDPKKKGGIKFEPPVKKDRFDSYE